LRCYSRCSQRVASLSRGVSASESLTSPARLATASPHERKLPFPGSGEACRFSTTPLATSGLCLTCGTLPREWLLSFFWLTDEAMDVAVRSVSQGDHGSVRTITVFQFKVKGAVGYSVLCHFITSEGFGRGRDLQYRMKLCYRASDRCGSGL
jgi:hypothetical protein